MSFIKFEKQPRPPNKVTDLYALYSVEGNYLLGSISWYPSWRKYCFHSIGEAVFDTKCLTEIINFINTLMEARKDV